MSSAETNGGEISLTVKGPSQLKLTVQATLDMTVLQLKQKIEETNKDFPAERYVSAPC